MSETRRRRDRSDLRRPAIVGALVGSLAVIAIAASVAGGGTQSAAPTPPVSLVASPAAESSQFTCAGFSVGGGSVAAATVSMTNTTAAPVTATVTALSNVGARNVRAVLIDANTTASIQPGEMVTGGQWAAATVLINGGGVAVTERIDGSSGVAATPCASSTAPIWNFAGNSTSRGQSPVISLVNPSSTPAVADVSFISAAAGAATPAGSQGLVVKPKSMIAVPVARLVPDGGDLATQVAVTQGSLVAFMTQVSPNPAGAAVSLGEPSVEASWSLPRAVATPSTHVAVEVANPTPSTQVVTVHVRLASGWVAPWTQTLDPYTLASIQTAPSSRVPVTSVYAATVDASGPGVVAFMSTTVPGATTSGWGITPLVSAASQTGGQWVVPAPTGTVRSGLSLFNRSSKPATVTLSALGSSPSAPVGQLTHEITVPAGAVISYTSVALRPSNGATLLVSTPGLVTVAQSFFGADPGVAVLGALPAQGS